MRRLKGRSVFLKRVNRGLWVCGMRISVREIPCLVFFCCSIENIDKKRVKNIGMFDIIITIYCGNHTKC